MSKKNDLPHRTAGFIESMECLPVPTVSEGPEWTYEIKLDGYRLEAVRSAGDTTLFSRRENILNRQFGFIADALKSLPDGTVIDGELVALDASGRPNFNLLQNFRSAESQISYFVFDILVHKNRDLTRLPLSERRRILRSVVEPTEHVGLSEVSDRTADEMLKFVREHGLEGLHLYEHRELAPDEKAKNLVLEYDPQPSQDMLVACVWDRWTRPGSSDLYSFAAITDEATPEVAATGHQRTVITLQERFLSEWLSPSQISRKRLDQILSEKETPYYVHQIAA